MGKHSVVRVLAVRLTLASSSSPFFPLRRPPRRPVLGTWKHSKVQIRKIDRRGLTTTGEEGAVRRRRAVCRSLAHFAARPALQRAQRSVK